MRALVIGLGRAGLAAGRLLSDLGYETHGYDRQENPKLLNEISDLSKVFTGLFLNSDPDELFADLDLMVLSPGVPPTCGPVVRARQSGIRVLGEAELCLARIDCPKVGITGTNGKTTTTELTGALLRCGMGDVAVCGNNGQPISGFFSNGKFPWSCCVAEMSSFMIDVLDRALFNVTMILNMTPDHLDRYGTTEEYYRSKIAFVRRTAPGGTAIVNLGCPATLGFLPELGKLAFSGGFTLAGFVGAGKKWDENHLSVCSKRAVLTEAGIEIFTAGTDETIVVKPWKRRIPGDHNMENIMAAVLAGQAMGLSCEQMEQGINSFNAVEHRLEPAGEFMGVRFINDSKGTNEDATVKALQAFEGPLTLIAGGYDKGAAFTDLAGAVARRSETAVVLMGMTARKIEDSLVSSGYGGPISMAQTLSQAIDMAMRLTPCGGTVLFSPGCASYDMFRDFEERGRIFKALVADLSSQDNSGSQGAIDMIAASARSKVKLVETSHDQ
ncbi:MAG: UDP-N-acetylmuramoyl-L-alanine--D-glutamate ligase [Candidatus Wallbacteria bacterium HGW-Wallbacteria-1]|jgi:UDP-N-acetylmuramoylalanine--D-glutamate ligase|uniref:UDP-N-acetylmuramoylalanine--D-glutamate ligase n=1 Tax=Candidatus Wallbacteria bacterium HGW-Wallbacteria-1 TaxID=2013854 RepID=A0A2N1PQC8_9BACT|nr:MAG: UDP-N-acetylmuramoyl-L-alanine--D-glutamate ligase [Candidatus Wallbacteria bacterium HGW-Wallbacteria-1]